MQTKLNNQTEDDWFMTYVLGNTWEDLQVLKRHFLFHVHTWPTNIAQCIVGLKHAPYRSWPIRQVSTVLSLTR
jgi:hypothetical protein